MNRTPGLTRVNELLDEIYRDRERLTRPELGAGRGGGWGRATDLDLAPRLRELVSMLPDGEYDRDRAGAELSQIQQEEGMWRDETSLPRADLHRAMATSGTEGQFDDPTGHEAGPAEAFGQEPGAAPAGGEGEPEPGTAEDRRLRPSPEGRTGPH